MTRESKIVYLLECEKEYCKKKYIGTTQQEFRDRIYQHIGYVRNKQISKATGEHFNLPGHRSHHMKFTILEKVKSLDPLYGRERESKENQTSMLVYAHPSLKTAKNLPKLLLTEI